MTTITLVLKLEDQSPDADEYVNPEAITADMLAGIATDMRRNRHMLLTEFNDTPLFTRSNRHVGTLTVHEE